MKVVFTMANNSSAPYFNWFAEKSSTDKELELIFVCLTPEKPQMIEDVGKYGCKCYWVKYDLKNRKRGFITAFFRLLLLFKKIKPDVVHSHLFDDAVPALLAAKLLNIPKRVITKADAGFHFFYAPQWVWVDKLNNLSATHIVCISSENKKFVEENENASPDKTSLIHHGVPVFSITKQDVDKKDFLRKKFRLEGKIVIGTIARLIEWKGYRYIIEAAGEIVKVHNNVIFLFVGIGGQEEELKNLVVKEGLQNHIIFTGWVDRDYVPSLYGIMDVYVHAASYEPFGFVIAEAMLNSVPLVTTRTGAAVDAVVHKENGYLVNHGDVRGIYEGIDFMINHAERKVIGKRAFDVAVNSFDFELMYANHKKLYFS